MQSNFEVQTYRNANLYQVFTYVKNMDGNKISVNSLDLSLPFDEIRNQLEKIVDDLRSFQS